jgi:hypothetical protein
MLRSVFAVILGYLAAVLLVVAGLGLAGMLFLPPPGRPYGPGVSPAYLIANVLVSIAAAVVGGLTAGIVARRSPILHASALAAIMFIVGIASMVASGGAAPGQPAWYPLAIAVIGPVGALVGGWLQQRRSGAVMPPPARAR